MYNPLPRSVHSVVAPRFFTNLEYSFTGNQTGAAGYRFSILGNALIHPGATSQAFTSNSGTFWPAGDVITTLAPVGFDSICGAGLIYDRYRVHASSITVTVGASLAAGGDSACALCVYPTCNEQALTSGQLQKASVLPYSKMIMTNGYGAMKDNTLTHKMDTKTIWGLSSTGIDDNYYDGNSAANPAGVWYWTIITSNYANSVVNVAIQVRVNYSVEFYHNNVSDNTD